MKISKTRGSTWCIRRCSCETHHHHLGNGSGFGRCPACLYPAALFDPDVVVAAPAQTSSSSQAMTPSLNKTTDHPTKDDDNDDDVKGANANVMDYENNNTAGLILLVDDDSGASTKTGVRSSSPPLVSCSCIPSHIPRIVPRLRCTQEITQVMVHDATLATSSRNSGRNIIVPTTTSIIILPSWRWRLPPGIDLFCHDSYLTIHIPLAAQTATTTTITAIQVFIAISRFCSVDCRNRNANRFGTVFVWVLFHSARVASASQQQALVHVRFGYSPPICIPGVSIVVMSIMPFDSISQAILKPICIVVVEWDGILSLLMQEIPNHQSSSSHQDCRGVQLLDTQFTILGTGFVVLVGSS